MAKLNAAKSFRPFKKYLDESVYLAGRSKLAELYETYGDLARHNYHLRQQVLPQAALCRALEQAGESRTAAIAEATEISHKRLSYPSAKKLRRLLKIPGLYKAFPRTFERIIRSRLFGPQNGFEIDFLPVGKGRSRFDIKRCPYYDFCCRLGYPELTFAFCYADEICYRHMHPKLVFERSSTLEKGAPQCDFYFYLKK